MSLAPFIQIVARGKGWARAMTLAEAQEAMTLILQGDAVPEAVGALLMVMRLRGETADEITVFGLRDGAHIQEPATPLIQDTRRLHEPGTALDLHALWEGRVDDPFAVATITGTAALALWTFKAAPTLTAADQLATRLWAARHHPESLSA